MEDEEQEISGEAGSGTYVYSHTSFKLIYLVGSLLFALDMNQIQIFLKYTPLV